jgi:predicted dehydrogenase
MVGYAFMGAAHSQAWRNAHRFFDLPLTPRMAVLGGRTEGAVRAAASRLGWADVETDWRKLVVRDDVDLVDIGAPGDTHAEIAIAALEAGKHVLCEKPLANTLVEASAMAAAAAAHPSLVAMTGFTFRRMPAIQLARRLVEQGRIGTVRHVRAQYLQDWLADARAPWVWRVDKAKAGSGALGDIGAHVVDLAQFITGESLTGVSAMLSTFVDQRPVPSSLQGLGGTANADSPMRPVTVDDAAAFLGRLSGGGMAVFEATRFAWGRRNQIRLEINGSSGSLAFDMEDMNGLSFFDATEPGETAGFRRIDVTQAEHPYGGSWWPAGHALGYEHAFTHQAVDLVRGIAAREHPAPTFADGLQVQRVLDAVERSAADASRWTAVSAAHDEPAGDWSRDLGVGGGAAVPRGARVASRGGRQVHDPIVRAHGAGLHDQRHGRRAPRLSDRHGARLQRHHRVGAGLGAAGGRPLAAARGPAPGDARAVLPKPRARDDGSVRGARRGARPARAGLRLRQQRRRRLRRRAPRAPRLSELLTPERALTPSTDSAGARPGWG